MVSNKEMTFLEKMYLIAIVKGLWITIQHFFTKKATIHYPEQVREMSPVYRGRHMLKRDEQGRENCTACGLCALSCPAEAITMKAAERRPDEKHLYREENMQKSTRSTCCVVFSVDCVKKLVRKMRFI